MATGGTPDHDTCAWCARPLGDHPDSVRCSADGFIVCYRDPRTPPQR
jgi:hypothetical protein